MSLTKRVTIVEGTNDVIKFVAKMHDYKYQYVFILLINDTQHDRLVISAFNGLFGYSRTLTGLIQENIVVKVLLRSHVFRRPEYIIYVGEQIVHKQKGTWCGF